MVNIDNVYQKVLVLANKEQRGYITPQEFNLFANQAQLEIFEQYFYDINQFRRQPGNEIEYSDMLDVLNQKTAPFETVSEVLPFTSNAATQNMGISTLPINLYRLGTVMHVSLIGGVATSVEAEELSQNDFLYIDSSPLTRPTRTRPIYIRRNNLGGIADGVQVLPDPSLLPTVITCTFIRTPATVRWGYVVISEKAMFDPSTTTHFELCPAEETDLVYKILKYAGVSMDKDSIMRAGQGMEMAKISQEKQ